ncbi:hypothetical protein TIFTF001_022108 [Ficus carica]|uniref:Uncharacterized protein n=1 Tax=Ficus carica TaxID=3494 RepID=A0AA88ATA0_FICCA|nr:hypothetical protein TIFTF001_022108 [Ficus carica]
MTHSLWRQMLVGDRPMNGDRNGVTDMWCTPFISLCNLQLRQTEFSTTKLDLGRPMWNGQVHVNAWLVWNPTKPERV